MKNTLRFVTGAGLGVFVAIGCVLGSAMAAVKIGMDMAGDYVDWLF